MSLDGEASGRSGGEERASTESGGTAGGEESSEDGVPVLPLGERREPEPGLRTPIVLHFNLGSENEVFPKSTSGADTVDTRGSQPPRRLEQNREIHTQLRHRPDAAERNQKAAGGVLAGLRTGERGDLNACAQHAAALTGRGRRRGRLEWPSQLLALI